MTVRMKKCPLCLGNGYNNNPSCNLKSPCLICNSTGMVPLNSKMVIKEGMYVLIQPPEEDEKTILLRIDKKLSKIIKLLKIR